MTTHNYIKKLSTNQVNNILDQDELENTDRPNIHFDRFILKRAVSQQNLIQEKRKKNRSLHQIGISKVNNSSGNQYPPTASAEPFALQIVSPTSQMTQFSQLLKDSVLKNSESGKSQPTATAFSSNRESKNLLISNKASSNQIDANERFPQTARGDRNIYSSQESYNIQQKQSQQPQNQDQKQQQQQFQFQQSLIEKALYRQLTLQVNQNQQPRFHNNNNTQPSVQNNLQQQLQQQYQFQTQQQPKSNNHSQKVYSNNFLQQNYMSQLSLKNMILFTEFNKIIKDLKHYSQDIHKELEIAILNEERVLGIKEGGSSNSVPQIGSNVDNFNKIYESIAQINFMVNLDEIQSYEIFKMLQQLDDIIVKPIVENRRKEQQQLEQQINEKKKQQQLLVQKTITKKITNQTSLDPDQNQQNIDNNQEADENDDQAKELFAKKMTKQDVMGDLKKGVEQNIQQVVAIISKYLPHFIRKSFGSKSETGINTTQDNALPGILGDGLWRFLLFFLDYILTEVIDKVDTLVDIQCKDLIKQIQTKDAKIKALTEENRQLSFSLVQMKSGHTIIENRQKELINSLQSEITIQKHQMEEMASLDAAEGCIQELSQKVKDFHQILSEFEQESVDKKKMITTGLSALGETLVDQIRDLATLTDQAKRQFELSMNVPLPTSSAGGDGMGRLLCDHPFSSALAFYQIVKQKFQTRIPQNEQEIIAFLNDFWECYNSSIILFQNPPEALMNYILQEPPIWNSSIQAINSQPSSVKISEGGTMSGSPNKQIQLQQSQCTDYSELSYKIKYISEFLINQKSIQKIAQFFSRIFGVKGEKILSMKMLLFLRIIYEEITVIHNSGKIGGTCLLDSVPISHNMFSDIISSGKIEQYPQEYIAALRAIAGTHNEKSLKVFEFLNYILDSLDRFEEQSINMRVNQFVQQFGPQASKEDRLNYDKLRQFFSFEGIKPMSAISYTLNRYFDYLKEQKKKIPGMENPAINLNIATMDPFPQIQQEALTTLIRMSRLRTSYMLDLNYQSTLDDSNNNNQQQRSQQHIQFVIDSPLRQKSVNNLKKDTTGNNLNLNLKLGEMSSGDGSPKSKQASNSPQRDKKPLTTMKQEGSAKSFFQKKAQMTIQVNKLSKAFNKNNQQ